MRPDSTAREARPSVSKWLPLVLALFLGSCANGYSRFYTSYVDTEDAQQASAVIPLDPGQSPKLIASSDPVADVRKLRAAGYVAIGYSGFTGPARPRSYIESQAKKVGATVVVHSSQYEETVSGSIDVPSSSTTYTSGSFYDGGSFSSTSTTYGIDSTPYSVKRYLQRAWFMAEATRKPRFGVSLREMTEADRSAAGRNTGATIDLVFDDTPAFAADLVPGDVLVAVDGTSVTDSKGAHELLTAVPAERTECEFAILRKGEERLVSLSGL